MRGIAILLVALWGILHRIVILGFRNFIAVMVSGVEEEGTRRGTTMCDAIERHCSGVEQAADPEDSLSGVEEPAGEEEETQQATASAAIMPRVEEEGSRQGTTSDDIIASHTSGAEEAAPDVPVYSVEQADGDGPTFDEGNEICFSGAEEIDRCLLLVRQCTSSDIGEHAALPESRISGVEEAAGESDVSMQYSSGDAEVARTGGKWFRSYVNLPHCTLQCVKIQENGSGSSLDYKSPVRSLKELEEAVEECNSISLSCTPCILSKNPRKRFDMNVPELEVTEELIKLLMRINKDSVMFDELGADWFLLQVFGYAWYKDVPNLMKLAVGMVKSSVVCPMSPFVNKATMDSAFMSCHTMPQLLKLLLDFNPNFGNYFNLRCGARLSVPWIGIPKSWVMMQEYNPIVFVANKGLKEANLPRLLGVPKDEVQCYSQTTNSGCTLQNLTNNQWKLDAHVTGLKSPWSKNFNQTSQKIELEVLMEPTVLLNNSLTLKISNLKFRSDNPGSNASAEILSRFFLSGVALTATPEVEQQDFMFARLGLGSANPAYDILSGTTLGTSATVPLGKGVPTLGFTSTQTISLTSKSVTDWKHEQTHGTQNCHSSKSGTFSWTLKNLGGIPFDRENPSYPRSWKKYRLELPFNEDGSVTFTDKEYPDPITWNFKPELEGTMLVWRISMEVYVTILNNSPSKSRSTSAGNTLKFCFTRHLQHKLSTESMRTSLVLQ